MEPVHGSVTAQGSPRLRRTPWRRLMAAATLFVVLAGAGFVWWGNPRLDEGSLIGPGDGMSWANDGVEDTRMLVRGRTAGTVSARFSIRNDGRLPFTVHGLDRAESGNWLSEQQVTFGPGFLLDEQPVTRVKQVTLNPGDEAIVFWSLDMPCPLLMAEGSSMDISTLRFTVSWLGARTIRELPLERPITFLGDDNTSRPAPNHHCSNE
jgi:hypothetical protein